MYRIFVFNEQMDIVLVEDVLGDKKKAYKRGEYLVKYHDLYTYAIGKLN